MAFAHGRGKPGVAVAAVVEVPHLQLALVLVGRLFVLVEFKPDQIIQVCVSEGFNEPLN